MTRKPISLTPRLDRAEVIARTSAPATTIRNAPVVEDVEPTIRTTIDMPASMHRGLKMLAAKRACTLADIIRGLVSDEIQADGVTG